MVSLGHNELTHQPDPMNIKIYDILWHNLTSVSLCLEVILSIRLKTKNNHDVVILMTCSAICDNKVAITTNPSFQWKLLFLLSFMFCEQEEHYQIYFDCQVNSLGLSDAYMRR